MMLADRIDFYFRASIMASKNPRIFVQIKVSVEIAIEDLRRRQYDLVGPEGETILPRALGAHHPTWLGNHSFRPLSKCQQMNVAHNITRSCKDWQSGKQAKREEIADGKQKDNASVSEGKMKERELWEDQYQRELDRRLTEMYSVQRVSW